MGCKFIAMWIVVSGVLLCSLACSPGTDGDIVVIGQQTLPSQSISLEYTYSLRDFQESVEVNTTGSQATEVTGTLALTWDQQVILGELHLDTNRVVLNYSNGIWLDTFSDSLRRYEHFQQTGEGSSFEIGRRFLPSEPEPSLSLGHYQAFMFLRELSAATQSLPEVSLQTSIEDVETRIAASVNGTTGSFVLLRDSLHGPISSIATEISPGYQVLPPLYPRDIPRPSSRIEMTDWMACSSEFIPSRLSHIETMPGTNPNNPDPWLWRRIDLELVSCGTYDGPVPHLVDILGPVMVNDSTFEGHESLTWELVPGVSEEEQLQNIAEELTRRTARRSPDSPALRRTNWHTPPLLLGLLFIFISIVLFARKSFKTRRKEL